MRTYPLINRQRRKTSGHDVGIRTINPLG